MKLFSPAKINLFLNVLHKRRDGYHAIETLFERLDLTDTIYLETIPSGIEMTAEGAEKVPVGPENLAWRAAKRLQESTGERRGVRIRLQKRIPVSAGLGGGSSNAATVLLGLNKLWKLRLPKKKLIAIASTIGSDVPFFILEAPLALGTGRGEILKKLPAPRRPIWHVLVKPPFGISTKEAYEGLSGRFLTPQKADVRMLLHSIQKSDSEALSKLLTNSLEVALNKRVRIILGIKKKLLDEGASATLLSGSGSCVFGLFSSEKKALKAAGHLRKNHRTWKVFTASTY